MKNWYKNQKGSMTAYAVITIFCFIFILTGLFLSSASIRKGQLRTIMEIVKVYKRDTQRVEEIYANRQILDTSKYVQNGLVLFYDGLNNTGSGHSNKATTWKDLSTSNFDGTLMNFEDNSWTNNSLTFDGIDDWVKITQMDYSNITMEIIMEYDNLDENSEIDIISNAELGGYGMDIHGSTYRDRNTFAFFLSGKGYQYIQSDNPAKIGKKYILTGSYDGSIVKFWENGIKKELNLEGTIGNPQNNTIMVLGANPNGTNATGCWFTGKIYAVRIYKRALTDEEVKQNYELDIQRYGVENIPTTVQEAIERDYRFDENRTILDKNNNKITIPAGFKIVQNGVNNTEYANPLSPTVDDGIVVADTTGNEFVWVPVENPEEMYGIISEDADGTKHYAGKLYDFANITNGKPSNLNWQEIDGKIAWTDENSYREPDTISNYDNIKEYQDILGVESITDFKLQLQEEFDYLVASINKYNGFYIGRYETGNLKQDKDNIPVVQKEKTDIVNVNWYYQYQTSKNIVSKNTDTRIQKSVTSSMIWGSQWDAVLNWFLKDANTKGYITNSDGMGWYDNNSDIILKATGTPIKGENEEVKNRVKNIYDMAGNVSEWTIEAYQTEFRVSRGGNFCDSASSYPAYYRGTSEAWYSFFYTGFRSTLIVNL